MKKMNNQLCELLKKDCGNATTTKIYILQNLLRCTLDTPDVAMGYYAFMKALLNKTSLSESKTLEILNLIKSSFNDQHNDLQEKFKLVDSSEELDKWLENITPFIVVTDKDETKFSIDMFVNYLIDTFNIVSIDNKIAFFDGKKYNTDEKSLNKIVSNILTLSGERLSSRARKDLIEEIKLTARPVIKNADFLISFDNCILKITPNSNWETLPISNKYYLTNTIPHKFINNPNEQSIIEIDSLLDEWSYHDEAIKANILEAFAYTFFPDNRLKKIFFFYGRANGGKSICIKLLKNMLGEDNISSVKLHDFSSRFELFHSDGKLANISDEVSSRELSNDDSNILKDLSSEAVPKMEQKGKDSNYSQKFSCKLIFGCNGIPSTKDLALVKRYRIIPFLNTFESGANYQGLIEKISKEDNLNALIYLVVKKLQLMVDKLSLGAEPFTPSKQIDICLSDYIHEIEPIKFWIDSEFDRNTVCNMFAFDKESGSGTDVDYWKSKFQDWYKETYSKDIVLSRTEFMNSVCRYLPDLAFDRHASTSKSSKIYIFYLKNNPSKSRGKNISKIDW